MAGPGSQPEARMHLILHAPSVPKRFIETPRAATAPHAMAAYPLVASLD